MDFLTQMLEAVSGWAGGVASSLYKIFINLFCEFTTATGGAITVTGLNYFGIVTCVFFGFSVVAGLGRLILKKLGW